MALDGLLFLVCAAVIGAPAPVDSIAGTTPAVSERQIALNLAVQSALLEGKQHLLAGDYRAAVQVLERQLPNINGNQVYLKLLQDAYRKYIRELRLSKQDEEAQRYLRRLLILDHSAVRDSLLSASGKIGSLPSASRAANENLPSTAQPPATVRPRSAESLTGNPTSDDQTDKASQQARQLLEKAEQEFQKRHFQEALPLYDQASQSDSGIAELCRERWGYCKLFCVADRINHASASELPCEDMEKEVHRGLELAPKLETFGTSLLEELARRKLNGKAAPPSAEKTVASIIKKQTRNVDGWQVVETANFRIFHNQPLELVEKVGDNAERSRAGVETRWFAGTSGAWEPKCDIYLHATAQDYARKTGQYNSPGHSTIRVDGGRLIERRIDLHCDEANMLAAVLPHETTHVVLAGQFGGRLVPRWADEGMAVLTEPRDKVEKHLSNLPRCKQQHKLYHLEDLMHLEAYPNDRGGVNAFYAQSVSLVSFLSAQRSEQEFTLFLRESLRYGYEKALERHYGLRSFADLERRWEDHAFKSRDSLTSLPQR
jgi:tetratricopeptide (TPR) repeat protein